MPHILYMGDFMKRAKLSFRRISRRIRLPSSRKSDRYTWHSGFLLYLYRNPRQKYFRAGYRGVPCRGTECFRHRVENKGFPRSPAYFISKFFIQYQSFSSGCPFRPISAGCLPVSPICLLISYSLSTCASLNSCGPPICIV